VGVTPEFPLGFLVFGGVPLGTDFVDSKSKMEDGVIDQSGKKPPVVLVRALGLVRLVDGCVAWPDGVDVVCGPVPGGV
jgi:hypothetical protein